MAFCSVTLSLLRFCEERQADASVNAARDRALQTPLRYHLDYADPFVQSVAQYLGRRTWHQAGLEASHVLLCCHIGSQPLQERQAFPELTTW